MSLGHLLQVSVTCRLRMGAIRWGTRAKRPPTFSDSGDI